MEDVTVFDVMYEVETPVSNVWEARMMAQGHLARDLNFGPDYTIEDWDAQMDNVQFRVAVWGKDVLSSDWFKNAVGARRAEASRGEGQ